jgi:hypothetical protein
MTNAIRAANQLRLYRRYLDIADRSGGDLRESYLLMARNALRQAEKFDPAAAAHASALAIAKAG